MKKTLKTKLLNKVKLIDPSFNEENLDSYVYSYCLSSDEFFNKLKANQDKIECYFCGKILQIKEAEKITKIDSKNTIEIYFCKDCYKKFNQLN